MQIMGENDHKATIHIPPEMLKTFAAEIPRLYRQLRETASKDLDETRHMADEFVRIAEMRISFSEKIILLASGTFALSVTFLGSLQRHSPSSGMAATWCLKSAWVLILVCIFLSWLHNRHRSYFIESIIVAEVARARSYYENQKALLWQRAANAFKGVESPELSVSAFFDAVANTVQKSSVDAEKLRDRMADTARKTMRTSNKLGDWAMLAIACAFVLMLVFAVKNASLF